MKLKKTMAFLLAMQMLLMGGVACSDTKGNEEETQPEETEAETKAAEGETEFDRRSVADNLPEITFDGQDFRFFANEGEIFQLVSEDTSGVGLDNAIYQRNARIEARFDVKIKAESSLGAESQDVILSYAQAGEHIAEVYDHWHFMGLTPPCYEMALNWLDMPHIDWSQPWWNQKSNENSTINGKLWTVTGDLAVTAMQKTWAIAFNMDLIKNYGYTSDQFYQLVLDGEWTLDKLIEIGSSIHEDDGDGIDGMNDIYGYVCNAQDRTMPWVTSIGEQFFKKTDDGMSLEVALGTEKVYRALEKLINFHHNVEATYCFADSNAVSIEGGGAAPLNLFLKGNAALFPTTFAPCYTSFREIDFTYGMLPFPKYDTAQEEYLTVPNYEFSVYGLPYTLPLEDYEMVGVIMEAMMAESWKTVSVAYYDEALKGAYSADATTAEVIDIIMDGRVYDWSYQIAQFIDTYKVPYLFCYAINKNDIDLASQLAEGRGKIQNAIDTCISFYFFE